MKYYYRIYNKKYKNYFKCNLNSQSLHELIGRYYALKSISKIKRCNIKKIIFFLNEIIIKDKEYIGITHHYNENIIIQKSKFPFPEYNKNESLL